MIQLSHVTYLCIYNDSVPGPKRNARVKGGLDSGPVPRDWMAL
jgi:hypothetical protein